MTNIYPDIMTIGETAAYLRISQSSLYKLAQGGRIPCQKVGRHWRFHRGALDRWLEHMNKPSELKDIPPKSESTQ